MLNASGTQQTTKFDTSQIALVKDVGILEMPTQSPSQYRELHVSGRDSHVGSLFAPAFVSLWVVITVGIERVLVCR